MEAAPGLVAAAADAMPSQAAAAAGGTRWPKRHVVTQASADVAVAVARAWAAAAAGRAWAVAVAAAVGGGGRGGGGGRRSDIALKHDIMLLGHLNNGLGYYRFVYNGSDRAYVGVMAQEVQTVRPDAVTRGHDGYLRVYYDRLGLQFQTYDQWIASGARCQRALQARTER